jgi:putative component of membrane protein insertase Oxa1/YidC/SpoIIIJ protein YidD
VSLYKYIIRSFSSQQCSDLPTVSLYKYTISSFSSLQCSDLPTVILYELKLLTMYLYRPTVGKSEQWWELKLLTMYLYRIIVGKSETWWELRVFFKNWKITWYSKFQFSRILLCCTFLQNIYQYIIEVETYSMSYWHSYLVSLTINSSSFCSLNYYITFVLKYYFMYVFRVVLLFII